MLPLISLAHAIHVAPFFPTFPGCAFRSFAFLSPDFTFFDTVVYVFFWVFPVVLDCMMKFPMTQVYNRRVACLFDAPSSSNEPSSNVPSSIEPSSE
jgi:hypothetical protein